MPVWEFQISDDGSFEIWEYDSNHHSKSTCVGKAKVSIILDIELNIKKGKATPAQRNAVAREITNSLNANVHLGIDKVILHDKRK